MKNSAIGVTEAGRNFAGCIARVRDQKETVVLTKHGSPVAKLVPEEKVCIGRELAETLTRVELCAEDAAAWHRDLRFARKNFGA